MVEPSGPAATGPVPAASGLILLTLASGQFLMALDSSVMNVSIATVAADLDTTVTGIQSAITFYTLVMSSLMITGGKIGEILGRKRAFAIGCVVYGCGSLTTSLAPNLAVLLVGWSVLEGVGAALIMPAIVALIAANFDRGARPRAYGLVAAAGAIAVALGPLIGGALTTYASWRWVFAGEVLIVGAILVLTRRLADVPGDRSARLDVVGTVLSALGLGLIVFAVIRSGTWGFVNPKPDAPDWLGLSPVIWLLLAGGLALLGFAAWERRRRDAGQAILFDPALLRNGVLRAGLVSFLFQYVVLAGVFFTVPLFLSVALGLSAIETGVRILPLSLALLATALGIPKLLPGVSPRLVVRAGFLSMCAGIVWLVAALDVDAGAEIVSWPMVLAGLGIGALASQLGSITVSSVPDERSDEVGGVQNSVMFLGSSIGTALAGAVLIAALTTSFFTNVRDDPAVPAQLTTQAEAELAGGVPFVSDDQLTAGLDDAGVPADVTTAIVDANADARVDGLRSALALLALLAFVALFAARGIPRRQPAAVGGASSEIH
ncbi:MFS transporter [Jiangella muralis]|uniref:MFS transporter n=1 Tax=Jiangella muralis TaxID=702383 RepID=UPI00069CC3EC|nr:MFS transporter [Jiangella muralis]